MAAVQDQKRQLEKWRAKFTPTVTRQLNNLFIHLVNKQVVGKLRYKIDELLIVLE